jgi:acyl-CoA reductase-like NAD-dependent aldehyde dehydrogenase
MQIINPATEEIIKDLEEDSRETVQKKYENLRKGQLSWAKVPVEERVACIQRFHDLLETEKQVLAETLTREVGKPLQQSFNELNGARSRLGFFIQHSAAQLADEWVTPDGVTREKIVYEPLGVVANISAWNYPYLVGINVFIPALIGGNAVMYKPSEYSTLTGLHIERLLKKAGIPTDAFTTIIGKGNVGGYLIDLPLDGYYFTGSYKTGRLIAERVAPKLVPCQLELGGKDPMYVMDDVADVKQAAVAAVEGVVYNNGQSCCAVERIYVQDKIYGEFVKAYLEELKRMKAGDPMQPGTDIGPLSRKDQVDFLAGQVNDATAKGAELLYGGKPVEGRGYYFEPAVLVNVNHEMNIMKEESFGPVVGIQKVKDDAEATRLMLDTEFGLTAAVYSTDQQRAEAVMRAMRTGTVYWNCCDRVSANLPWSGRGHSGLGSTLGAQGIRAFVQPKAYHLRF